MTSITEQENCPICIDQITDLHTTECDHKFCKCCIDRWLESHINCPLCRHQLIIEPTVELQEESIMMSMMRMMNELEDDIADEMARTGESEEVVRQRRILVQAEEQRVEQRLSEERFAEHQRQHEERFDEFQRQRALSVLTFISSTAIVSEPVSEPVSTISATQTRNQMRRLARRARQSRNRFGRR